MQAVVVVEDKIQEQVVLVALEVVELEVVEMVQE
jgi:hypothetical protein